MNKIIPAVTGLNKNQILQSIPEEKLREDQLKRLGPLLSPDACISERQLQASLDSLDHPTTIYPMKLLAFAGYINGARLKCAQCINEPCTQRSEEPIAQSEKRAITLAAE